MNNNKQSHLVSNTLVFLGLVISIALLALVFSGDFTEAKITAKPTTQAIPDEQPLPNLSGDEAKEYLKEQGLYESLGEAMKAARLQYLPDEKCSASE